MSAPENNTPKEEVSNSELKDMIALIYRSVEDSKKDIRSEIKEVGTNVAEVGSKIDKINEKVYEIEEKVSKHEEKISILECQLRRKNVILLNFEEIEKSTTELEQIVLQILSEVFKIEVSLKDLDFVYRLGVQNKNKTRPIKIGFLAYRTKCLIMDDKIKLKAYNTKNNTNLILYDDLPKDVLEKRKNLLEKANTLRNMNGNAEVKVKNNRLIVDGKTLTAEEIINIKTHPKQNKRKLSDDDFEKDSDIARSSSKKNSRPQTKNKTFSSSSPSSSSSPLMKYVLKKTVTMGQSADAKNGNQFAVDNFEKTTNQ